MKIKILGIGTDCISLFTNEEFIGYIGLNMFYFDRPALDWYGLYESQLLDIFRPKVKNGEIKLNDVKIVEI